MPVIEAQCASILVPHNHRHINHVSTVGALGQASLTLLPECSPVTKCCIGGTVVVSPTQHFGELP
jgi:hypothetical protein